MALQVNVEKLKRVGTPLVGINGRPIKVEGSLELPITLGKKDNKVIFHSYQNKHTL